MSQRKDPHKRLSGIASALVALGEEPDAPVIESAEGSVGPLWTTDAEKREIEEFADKMLLAELRVG